MWWWQPTARKRWSTPLLSTQNDHRMRFHLGKNLFIACADFSLALSSSDHPLQTEPAPMLAKPVGASARTYRTSGNHTHVPTLITSQRSTKLSKSHAVNQLANGRRTRFDYTKSSDGPHFFNDKWVQEKDANLPIFDLTILRGFGRCNAPLHSLEHTEQCVDILLSAISWHSADVTFRLFWFSPNLQQETVLARGTRQQVRITFLCLVHAGHVVETPRGV